MNLYPYCKKCSAKSEALVANLKSDLAEANRLLALAASSDLPYLVFREDVDPSCTFWEKGQCDRPDKEPMACWSCNQEMVAKLKRDLADADDRLENLEVQAVRDVAKGWVSVPEVEWDSIMKPRNGVETPPAELEALNNADLTDTELARNATGGEVKSE